MEEHSELCDCVVLYLNTGKRVLNDCLNFRKKKKNITAFLIFYLLALRMDGLLLCKTVLQLRRFNIAF